MDLNQVRNTALELMKQHGISDWTFKWDNTVGRFGFCDCTMKQIILSRPMTSNETDSDRINNTILHEIAHALDCLNRGKTNHDSEWEKIAKSIGCSGSKCGSVTSLNKDAFIKWKAECSSCDKEYYKYHKPKTRLSCSQCDAKYNPEFELDFKFNPKGSDKY